MGNLIPLFRTDSIAKWESSREKVYKDAEKYFEGLLKDMRKKLFHLVYLCSPLKSTAQKLIQDHIAEAILATSQILGAKYNGKKIAVWIPHVHLFSIYNEIVYPDTRDKAIKFNNHLIKKYFHTLLIVGDRISGGMSVEIDLAKKNGIEVIKMGDFRIRLKNLPKSERISKSYQKMINIHNKIHGPGLLIK